MLELRRMGIFSNEYEARENGAVVGTMRRSRWRARGEMTVAGRVLQVARRGMFKSTYTLADGDVVLARAEQEGIFTSKLHLQVDGRNYRIRNRAWYSSTLIVESGHSFVGKIRPKGWWSADANVEFPAGWSPAVRLFLAWLGVVRWEESSGGAAGAAAAAG